MRFRLSFSISQSCHIVIRARAERVNGNSNSANFGRFNDRPSGIDSRLSQLGRTSLSSCGNIVSLTLDFRLQRNVARKLRSDCSEGERHGQPFGHEDAPDSSSMRCKTKDEADVGLVGSRRSAEAESAMELEFGRRMGGSVVLAEQADIGKERASVALSKAVAAWLVVARVTTKRKAARIELGSRGKRRLPRNSGNSIRVVVATCVVLRREAEERQDQPTDTPAGERPRWPARAGVCGTSAETNSGQALVWRCQHIYRQVFAAEGNSARAPRRVRVLILV